MIVFRLYVITLPQTLLLLLLATWFDLLGGWNHSDAGFHALILLSLATPFFTLALLVLELVRYRRQYRQHPDQATFLWPGVALFLCLETLSVNLFILSQLRM
ncbi:MAG: hypothetical protein RQ754_07035 [Desulfuromonadales bacterium]|jgi:hypothetical protein|nr:hypothetical protein [Desulfuromonadales bacterium]